MFLQNERERKKTIISAVLSDFSISDNNLNKCSDFRCLPKQHRLQGMKKPGTEIYSSSLLSTQDCCMACSNEEI